MSFGRLWRTVRHLTAEQWVYRFVCRGRRIVMRRFPGVSHRWISRAADRLPLERLHKGLPALVAQEDVHTNHIQADDLARICLAAMRLGAPNRVYHAVDDSDLKMGDYFDAVADAAGLSRPPRLPRSELERSVSPMMLSFMSESRRLHNARIKEELGVQLRYPDVQSLLAQWREQRLTKS